MKFKEFVLVEQKVFLSEKIGDILTSAQELLSDVKHMGTRDLARFSERIVNQIRTILHSYWPKENQKYLKILQKIGVSLIKAIKEKGDLEGTISGVTANLEKLIGDMGSPVNRIGTDANKPAQEKELNATGVEKNVKDQYAAPVTPTVIEKTPDISNPISSDPNAQSSQPLGGSSGQLSAF